MSTLHEDPELSHDPSPGRNSMNRRFRDSTHLLPSPGQFKMTTRYNPIMLSLPVIIATPILLLAAGLALEVAIFLSNKNGGFAVPARNVFQIASTQFLLSFFPTILVYPLGLVWRELDWMMRQYQPYVVLSRGNAKADESLLLDYISLGPVLSLLYSLRFKHRIIFFSSATALVTYILQPLAGSIFQVIYSPYTQSSSVTSIKTVGLDPSFTDLNAFSAAAGFAEAAVFNNLTDPPFISGGWATAEFVFPTYSGLAGSMTTRTTGIKTSPNCQNPDSTPLVTPTTGSNITISASSQGCPVVVTFDSSVSSQQYGVVNTSCGSAANLPTEQQEVMFWYFHVNETGVDEARAVFCSPSIQVFDVTATADLATGDLANVTIIDNYPVANNVTGPPLNSQPFNGVVFSPSANPFIQARATATNNGVPGAIFRFASQLPNGPQGTFDEPNGFLDITTHVYTQHLSLIAKSVYFVSQSSTIPAQETSFIPRLTINALPAHPMALSMILVGIMGIVLTILNRRQRRSLVLATPPGTIASSVALTAHSGFGELLHPYDNEDTIERKLKGFRFRFDKRTGAIIATEHWDSSEEQTFLGLPQEKKGSRFSNTLKKRESSSGHAEKPSQDTVE